MTVKDTTLQQIDDVRKELAWISSYLYNLTSTLDDAFEAVEGLNDVPE